MTLANVDRVSFNKVNQNSSWEKNKESQKSQKVWTLPLKHLGAFDIVKKKSNLGVAVAQDLSLENVTFSKFASQ